MEKIERINDIISAGECPDGMEEKVIALASGEITTAEERTGILIHILTCDPCRYLFEDSLLLHRELTGNTDDSEDTCILEFGIKGPYIIPSVHSPAVPDAVSVLSGGSEETAEFRIPYGKDEIILKAIRSQDGADIDIEAGEDESRLYLIGNNKSLSAFPYKGTVRFENITPGTYALSRDLKKFIFINIITEK